MQFLRLERHKGKQKNENITSYLLCLSFYRNAESDKGLDQLGSNHNRR